MTFSALDSKLTGPLFASAAMRAVFSDDAKIARMLNAEVALAKAEAGHGLAPKGLAVALRRIKVGDLDSSALGALTVAAGMPSIPFVEAVEARLPENLRGYFHRGATSQDILDTALVLQVADGLDLVEADLAAIVTGLARLARAHRMTPQAGRTYGQHAAPITFGYAVATWLAGIAELAAELPHLRARVLTAALGGPVGTLAGLGDKAAAVGQTFADELGLQWTPAAWQTLRARPLATGTWLAAVIGATAKMATDVVHLSSTEIGEVAEPRAPGRGGSSAMPHKQNPVSATVILAAHAAAAGHVVTLLHAMAAGQQRPAGAWHAEWHALPQLFGLASGALGEARRLAEGLFIRPDRMRANLDLTQGLLFSGALAARLAPVLGRDTAHRLVARAADRVRDTGEPLRDVVAADPGVPEGLRRDIDAAFDLKPALATAAAATDRILAAVTSAARPARSKRKV